MNKYTAQLPNGAVATRIKLCPPSERRVLAWWTEKLELYLSRAEQAFAEGDVVARAHYERCVREARKNIARIEARGA